MVKEIMLNGVKTNIQNITMDDIIMFIEREHPEDKQKFAKLVFNKVDKVYNHFRARNVFLNLYFPEMIERKERITASDKIRSWLEPEKTAAVVNEG